MNILDPITALGIFAGWTLIAIPLGLFIGKFIRFGTRVEPYDRERDQ